jgi:D-alanyl-D-alanine endopeptidase (penicillin-binding protein 7)
MIHHIKKESIDVVIMYGLSFCFIVALLFLHHKNPKNHLLYLDQTHPEIAATSSAIFDIHAFDKVSIEGKAYVVYDLTTATIIAGKNETTILPLASITKVMTALSSIRHKSKDEKITVNKKSIEDSYDLGLKNHQVWSLSELLKYTLIFSSNDGAEVVADSFGSKDIFLTQMNADAKELGLNFIFTDPAGRDIDGNIGGKGNALDVAKLFGIARKNFPEVLDATTKKRQTLVASTGKVIGIPNTNQSIESLSGAEASKTGFTDLAGGNLGVVVDISIGRPVVIVVLGSTREGRFRDMDLLYTALAESIRK